jgi:hypothetical protein
VEKRILTTTPDHSIPLSEKGNLYLFSALTQKKGYVKRMNVVDLFVDTLTSKIANYMNNGKEQGHFQVEAIR